MVIVSVWVTLHYSSVNYLLAQFERLFFQFIFLLFAWLCIFGDGFRARISPSKLKVIFYCLYIHIGVHVCVHALSLSYTHTISTTMLVLTSKWFNKHLKAHASRGSLLLFLSHKGLQNKPMCTSSFVHMHDDTWEKREIINVLPATNLEPWSNTNYIYTPF